MHLPKYVRVCIFFLKIRSRTYVFGCKVQFLLFTLPFRSKMSNTSFHDYGQPSVKTNFALPRGRTEFKGPGKRGHIVADTLLPMMFLGLRKLGNICCRHKMFLNKDTKFVSATNVARPGKRGNICVGNNVSATMCPRLPRP